MEGTYYEIIIIGGGAAGLMAGTAASGQGRKVLILEKMPRPGRKIMITGKGRCNMSNMKDWPEFSEHLHPSAAFIKNAFYGLTSQNLIEFFHKNGLETVTERGDRVFPASYKAVDVVDTLVSAATKAGAVLQSGAEVESITCTGENQTHRFKVSTKDGKEYDCQSLIICTGGLSYPTTGSTGDGLRWAEGLNLKVTKCFPSLTAIVPKGYKIAESNAEMKGHISRETQMSEIGKLLNGNQLKNVSIKVSVDGDEVREEFGDLDFTDGGIEGPIGFKVSRTCVKALINGSKVKVAIDLKPGLSPDRLEAKISSMREETLKRNPKTAGNLLSSLLPRLLPQSLIPGFLKTTHLEGVGKLGRTLKNWEFDIAGFVGYERCVITAGGVSVKELSPKTLECKKIKGLYFAGEILDVDADTGGYNLQCAFSTGWLAGKSAADSI